jgi:hypothetical protein
MSKKNRDKLCSRTLIEHALKTRKKYERDNMTQKKKVEKKGLNKEITLADMIAQAQKEGMDIKFHIEPEDLGEEDNINPSHYQDGGIEIIDVVEAKATPEEFEGYCKWSAFVYISRAGKKKNTSATEDKQKAVWYLNKSIEADMRRGE